MSTTTALLTIETKATNQEAALARIQFAASNAYGAEFPVVIAFRRADLVGLDDERRLVYAWRALVHDAAATPATPELGAERVRESVTAGRTAAA